MKGIVIFIFLFSTGITFAQKPSVRLRASKTEVRVGEEFTVELTATTNGNGNIDFPVQFQILEQKIGSNSQNINGKTSMLVTRTYTIICNQNGTYDLQPVVWTYGNNQKIKSNALKIIVGKGGAVAEPSNTNPPSSNEAHFGVLSTTKKEVYVGEPFVVSGKVFFDGHIVDVNSLQVSETDLSIHKTDVFGKAKQLTVERESAGNKLYETILFFENLIVPQQMGQLRFDAFSVNIGYQRNFFNTAFVSVKSNALAINILPLPQNPPEGFNGAVGQFNLQTKTDLKKKLEVGQVFTVTIKLEGKGNIHLIKPLEFNLPNGLVLYGNPKIDNQVFTTRKGAHGHLEYEYILQVIEPGNYNFKPFEFAYFNPETKSYKSIEIEAISFDVLRESVSNNEKNQVNSDEQPKEDLLSSGTGIVAGIFLVLLFISIGIILLWRKRYKSNSIKSPKIDAHKVALSALSETSTKDLDATHGAIEHIVLQFFRDLTKNEKLFLNDDWFIEAAEKETISPDLAENWRTLYADIQASKYANMGNESAESLLKKTRNLVEKTNL